MKKRLFQVLDEMNVGDSKNNTQNVAIANTLVSAEKCKQGGLVTMGVDHANLQRLVFDGDNYTAILLVVNRKEYEKQQEVGS